jgi:CubicO group peptidase (beta-lactamase class C family)
MAGVLAGCKPVHQLAATPTNLPKAPATSMPTATPPTSMAYWPTDGWRISTPEQQGMDSEVLIRLLEHILDQAYRFTDIRDLLLIRNGHVVLEICFNPAERDSKFQIICATRSFISALTGIAIDQGHLTSVDQHLLDLFPDQQPADDDPRKKTITLAHLLTSTSGLTGSQQEQNWLQTVLDAPLSADPGTTFGFGTDPRLLSMIIEKTSGTDILSFAGNLLLGPLGVSDVVWGSNPDGTPSSTGLELIPRDLAKFGLLYLNKGLWDGNQIVPEEWVDQSTQSYSSTGCNLGFGYQWWHHRFGAFAAQSGRAQCYVVPDSEMIAVITSDPGIGYAQAGSFVEFFFLPAVKSSEPLPENAAAFTQLESLVDQIESLNGS